MITFDANIHLGDAILTAAVGIVGSVVWRAARSITQFIRRTESFDRRIETTAEVVDLHTDVLVKSGWAKGALLPPVSRKRRRHDVEFSG